MGLLDNMKARIGPAKEKVSHLAQRHGGTIGHGLERAAKLVDEKTKGKYSDKIQAGTGKAKEAMDRLAHRSGRSPEKGEAPQAGETPRSASPPSSPEGPPPVS
ncbi:antitoxin [Streptomyces thermoalcalitolerans]|uniref:Antitoxin n=1 Tax=Streptomyces thermoalcalitolerans TaxID=65605 RepID=A0ABN1NVB6_9ACTN